MRENRTYGSEGGEPSNGSLPYPYQTGVTPSRHDGCKPTINELEPQVLGSISLGRAKMPKIPP